MIRLRENRSPKTNLVLLVIIATVCCSCLVLYDQFGSIATPAKPQHKNMLKFDSSEQLSIFVPNAENVSVNTLLYTLEKHSDKNKTIFVSLVDYAFVDVAINLYLTSFKRLSIANYLFVALNTKCCDILRSRKIDCVHYTREFEDGNSASRFGSTAYNVKTNFKIKLVLDVMQLGFNPFLVDLDIVFFANLWILCYH